MNKYKKIAKVFIVVGFVYIGVDFIVFLYALGSSMGDTMRYSGQEMWSVFFSRLAGFLQHAISGGAVIGIGVLIDLLVQRVPAAPCVASETADPVFSAVPDADANRTVELSSSNPLMKTNSEQQRPLVAEGPDQWEVAEKIKK